jgi:polysaccharide export outer membrane protein
MERFKVKYQTNITFLSWRYTTAVVLLAFILLLTGCGLNKNSTSGNEVLMDRTTFSSGHIEYPFDLFPEYRIRPGDILDVLFQIRTWIEKKDFKIAINNTVGVNFVHAPELNQKQTVRPDGHISLPYIGSIRVNGKSVDELTIELKRLYKTILQKPDLYIVVPEFRSRIKELKADLHTAPRGLSRLVTVRPDGYVTFPMVGNVFVANKTILEVNKLLNDKYEEIIPDLYVDLFLEKHSSTLVYVLGQVGNPGAYKITRPITVLESLALAGSHLPGAKLSSIIVIRKHEKKIIATRIDVKSALALKDQNKFFFLQPEDIVYVPRTWISKTAELMRDIGDIILFKGWSVGFSWELHDANNNNNKK